MKLIAFDLDDTLYKERDYVDSAFRRIAGFLSDKYDLPFDGCYKAMSAKGANPFDSLFGYLSSSGVVIEEDTQDLLKLYRNHFPDIKLDASTEQTLRELSVAGNRLALITDGRTVGQTNKIKALGLDRIIPSENISISEAIGCDKHSPAPFARMMELNPGLDGYVYVGDNVEKDFLLPNRLGWITVRLLDPQGLNIPRANPTQFDSEHQAQVEINSIDELLDFL